MISARRARSAHFRMRLCWYRRILLGAVLLLILPVALAPQQPAADELRQLIRELRAQGSVRIGTVTVAADPALLAFYERHAYTAAWTHTASMSALERAISNSSADGLDPRDYYLAELVRAAGKTSAEVDILRTAALIRLCRHVRFGRVPTQYPAADVATDDVTMAAQLRFIIANGDVASAATSLRPAHFTYEGLLRSLAQLRTMQARGGWPVLRTPLPLRLGDTGSSIRSLRDRLVREGYAVRNGGTDTVFDQSLRQALVSFQHRHALNEDGVLGAATLAELNVPIQDRIDQVRVNLERARWIAGDLPARFLAVNIAGAMTYLVRDDSVVFETRAVVGQPYTRTPVFQASMTHLELNPSWTVPRGIVDEVLAAVRRDPHYLQRVHMRVIDSSGNPVPVSARELAAMTARTFDYTFRQDPGPANPLGAIKFVFPNRFNVYLHDTPARSLFGNATRTFSHGCIRVQDPTHLAALILDDPHWTSSQLDVAMRTGVTQRISLRSPLPVLVLYWTASADLHGELHYYRDVYDRDAEILRALNASTI